MEVDAITLLEAFGIAKTLAAVLAVFALGIVCGWNLKGARRDEELKLADRQRADALDKQGRVVERAGVLENELDRCQRERADQQERFEAAVAAERGQTTQCRSEFESLSRFVDQFKASGQYAIHQIGDRSATIILFTNQPAVQLIGDLKYIGTQRTKDINMRAYGDRRGPHNFSA